MDAPDGPKTQGPEATRRAVLAGAGAAAVVVLTGCQTYGQGTGGGGNVNGGGDPGGAGGGGGGGTGTGGGGGAVASPLAQTNQIPVGGGAVFDQRRVVVTQPQPGTFKAFTAVCTHQGCVVADVKNGTINCPCHGSAFKVADGSVANGPASRPLKAVEIKVEGADIFLV
jgi:nitrite reductase/ring-hydroxylating ferredoxin subunit